MYRVRVDLPPAITEQCYPTMTEDESGSFYTEFREAEAEEARANTTNGGLRAIDIYTAWQSYIERARLTCT